MKLLVKPRRDLLAGLALCTVLCTTLGANHSTPLGAALGLTQAAHAQTGPTADLAGQTRQRVSTAMARMQQGAAELNLTVDQKAKLKSQVQKNLPRARAIWEDKTLTPGQKRVRLAALREEARSILTPAQQKKAQELRGRALSGLFQHVMWVSDQLELTPDQQEDLRTVVTESLQPGKTRGTAQGGPNLAALRSLMEDTQGKVNAVLTPQQQSKWSVIRSAARQTVAQKLRERKNKGGAPFQDMLAQL